MTAPLAKAVPMKRKSSDGSYRENADVCAQAVPHTQRRPGESQDDRSVCSTGNASMTAYRVASCPTSPVMTSPNSSHASPLNRINCICSIG